MLVDLAADPKELQNLAKPNPELLASVTAEMLAPEVAMNMGVKWWSIAHTNASTMVGL